MIRVVVDTNILVSAVLKGRVSESVILFLGITKMNVGTKPVFMSFKALMEITF
jgi:predicted nucleic acid-binding protein